MNTPKNKHAAQLGKLGGYARAKALGPERLSEAMKKARAARTEKQKLAREAKESVDIPSS